MGFEHWVAAAGDLLFGASCHGCGQPWWVICPHCRQQIASRRPFFTTPIPCPDGFPVTVTSSTYDPILRSLISAHKERQALALTSFLADRLALSVHGLLAREPYPVPTSSVVLVPIPSAAAIVRRRGFDATASMARLAARRLRGRYPVTVRSALTQGRRVADQAGLGATARQENLSGAFLLRRPISTGAAVLVDDLVTTGSSLTEAARVLRTAGIMVLGAATVAVTVRVRPPNSPNIGAMFAD
ncbi:MAG TPA: ComF family protein [Propionibacteriaceae bacterium]|nr:ComF family protein [Propionibacteriaceae bacterium]